MHLVDLRGFCARAMHESAGAHAAARTCLTPFSWAYGGLMRLRRAAWRPGRLSSARMDAPVISVGNITTGGVGKTPLVEWLARRLAEWGRRPAILSRGYGTAADSPRNDEAMMLQQQLPAVAHYADPDRVRSARAALAAGADCLLLDDGFQHLRIHRNLDLVLVDALDPFGGGRVLPAGLLREPLSALRDADAVILTRADALPPPERERLTARLTVLSNGAPVCAAAHRPTRIRYPLNSRTEAPGALAGRRVALFCAIGNPRGFLHTAQSIGAQVVAATFFPDHSSYTPESLAGVVARAHGVECVLTTAKDIVKIPAGFWRPDAPPLAVLDVEMAFLSGQAELTAMVRAVLE